MMRTFPMGCNHQTGQRLGCSAEAVGRRLSQRPFGADASGGAPGTHRRSQAGGTRRYLDMDGLRKSEGRTEAAG